MRGRVLAAFSSHFRPCAARAATASARLSLRACTDAPAASLSSVIRLSTAGRQDTNVSVQPHHPHLCPKKPTFGVYCGPALVGDSKNDEEGGWVIQATAESVFLYD